MKKTSKTKNSSEYQLLMYVEDSIPKLKKFSTMEEAGKFVDKFQKKYPDYMSTESGHWIDFVVTGVTGDIHFFTDGIEVA